MGFGFGFRFPAGSRPGAGGPSYPAGMLRLWSVDNATLSGSDITGIVDPVGGVNLTQATGTKRATIAATASPLGGPAMLFDGVDDFYKASFTQAMPYARIVVAKCIDAAGTLVDGNAGNKSRIHYTGGTIRAYGGAALVLVTATLTGWNIYSVEFNGDASSNIRINAGAPTVGAVGTSGADGVTIGTFGDGTSDPANAYILAVADCTVASRATCVAWLNSLYSVF